MTLHLTNRRTPTSLDDLNALESQQIAHAGSLYDGHDLPASARLGGPSNGEEGSFLYHVEIWDLVDVNTREPVFTFWSYNTDSGTFFKAGTTEVVAEVIQFYADQAIDTATHERIGEAYQHAKAALPAGKHPPFRWTARH